MENVDESIPDKLSLFLAEVTYVRLHFQTTNSVGPTC